MNQVIRTLFVTGTRCLIASCISAGNVLAECPEVGYESTLFWGSTDVDRLDSLAVDVNGDLWECGDFSGVVDFDPLGSGDTHESNGKSDVVLAKRDGVTSFAYTIGGVLSDAGTGVTFDASGSILLIGSFQDNVDFDPTSNEDSYSSNGSQDAFISKYSDQGDYYWTRVFGAGCPDSAFGIGFSDSNDLVISGVFNELVDFDPAEETTNYHESNGIVDTFVVTLDEDGNHLWSVTFGGSVNDDNWDLALDSANDVYTVGTFGSTVDFDPSEDGEEERIAVGGTDGYLHKLDANGIFQWVVTLGSPLDDSIAVVTTDAEDNVITLGCFQETIDFDPGEGVFEMTSNGWTDVFVLKLDPDGNFIWAVSFGGDDTDGPRDVITDAEGNIYIAGLFGPFTAGPPGYAVDFDPGPGEDIHTSNGMRDAFVMMLHADGSYGWTYTFGGEESDYANAVALGPNGEIYVGGDFRSTVDFDPNGPGDIIVSHGENDAFLMTLQCTDSISCDGDANSDGVVDPLDSGYVLSRFGCPVNTGDEACDAADVNGDGVVDPLDVGYILARFGTCE